MLSEVGVGISCVYRLNSVGEIDEPCGVSSLISQVFDEMPFLFTCADFPDVYGEPSIAVVV